MSYPHDHENEVTYFARTNYRNQMTKFGIKTDDRRRHMYIIGKTGMGKTTLMENMILSDIYAGHGCCYVDPHGDTAERLIDFIPSWRINDVVYFNPADMEYPIGFNILEAVDESHKHLVASGMMGVFKKIWENMWSARMEYILNNSILALMDNPGSTLLGINRMFSDADYRKRIVGNIKDPIVKAFWVKEYASYSERYATEAVAAIQNKIGQFLSAAVIRNIVAQVKSTINIREIMDTEKILIVNLSKGRVGEDTSRLLGGMVITKIQLGAMERVDMLEEERKDFYLYVDEFQNFAVESFASILSEARKYRLCLTMAHQYIAQLSDEVREAVFGNVGSIVAYRVGAPDAEFMEQEFTPRFAVDDIINLPKYNVYLKLLIDGVTSPPFSAITLPPIAKRTYSTEKVVRVSRERYANPVEEIEEKILRWSGMGEDADVDTMLAEAEKKKKEAKKNRGKPRHEYDCTRCDTHIVLPVELDRSRPIYCEDCIKIVREERKNKKKGKKKNSPSKPKSKPKPSEGEPVEILPDEPSISLKDMAPTRKGTGGSNNKKEEKNKKQEKKPVAKKKERKKKPEKKREEKKPPKSPSTSSSKKKPAKQTQKKPSKQETPAPKKSFPMPGKRFVPPATTKVESDSGTDDAPKNNPSSDGPKKKKRRRRRKKKSASKSPDNPEKKNEAGAAERESGATGTLRPGQSVTFE